MATNDRIHDITKPGSNSTEEESEADIVPLQRCPHLYIKYTAAKGTIIPPPFATKPVVVGLRRFATQNKITQLTTST